MRSLVRLLVASLTLFWLSIPAVAQPPGGLGTFIVASCGTLPTAYTAGQFNRAIVMDVNGSLCSSVSASITGFTPATTGTPISVTTGGVTGTLPAGAVVVASNVGTTNLAYCKLGASATTADQPIAPNGGWFPFTVGAATQLTCITSTSTTTVNMVGGAGLPTGTGGGGGGGGGAVTIADGADVNAGTTTDAAATQGGTGTLAAKLRLITSQLNTISTNTAAAIPAGTNTIGGVTGVLGTSGGWTAKRLSALSTTVTAIKSSAAGQLGMLHCGNPNSSDAFVQLFAVATAGGVTLGTTVPDMSFRVPANNATGYALALTGIQFANGIQIAATTTATGSSAPSTALDCNSAYN